MKGSDIKVMSKLNNYSLNNILKKTVEHMDIFAKKGLRTLCYSYKIINEVYYKKWEKKFNEKKYEVQNNKNKINELEDLKNEIEKDQTLLGVSALEDKLQKNVKNDIINFIDAGINFWMITGDKMDTAESIGYACKLFDDDTEVFKIRESKDVNKVYNRMKNIKEKIIEMQKELNEFKLHNAEKKKDKRNENNENGKNEKDVRYGENENNIIN